MKRGSAKLRGRIRRRRWLKQYLGGGPGVAFDAQQAVLAAGFTKNESSANVIGSRMLAHPEIRRELEKYVADPEEVEGLKRELRAIAYSRTTDLGYWDNEKFVLYPSRLLTDSQVAAVQNVEVQETERRDGDGNVVIDRKVRAHHYAKWKAIELLLMLDKRLVARHEVSGPGGGPIQHEHVVFYLPAPARLRNPVTIVEATVTDVAPTNGDDPALPPASGNGQSLTEES